MTIEVREIRSRRNLEKKNPWGGPTPPAPLSPPLMMGVLNMFFGVAESISGGLFDDSIDPQLIFHWVEAKIIPNSPKTHNFKPESNPIFLCTYDPYCYVSCVIVRTEAKYQFFAKIPLNAAKNLQFFYTCKKKINGPGGI